MIRLEINGQRLQVEEGSTILKAAKGIGINIPTLCYHEFIQPYSACRICLVEVTQNGKTDLQTACSTQAEAGMVVYTASDRVLQTRRMILELMLARSPEVEVIQQLAADAGVDVSRFEMEKPERCILCGLCVRVCEEVVGLSAIHFANRGSERKISTPFQKESDVCIACGACAHVCPTQAITVEDFKNRDVLHQELNLGPTTAIRVPFRQAIPNVPFIDKEACIHFKTENCKLCEKVCEPDAIHHEMEDEIEEIEVGSVVLATGYELLDCSKLPRYGYGIYDNVITSLEFEHLCHASGPTGGRLLLQDGKDPGSVAILHCVGSRDKNQKSYCSKVCCMYAMKFAHLVHEKTDAHIYEFYIDVRSAGKGYEEFYDRMLGEGVTFIRGKGAEVNDVALTPEEEGKLVVRCEDTLIGMVRRIPVDMVILCPAMVPRHDTEEVAKLFGICASQDGFFREQHPKLGPVSTDSDGVFLAGACQGPKDIPETVAQGAGAAGAVLSLGDAVDLEPIKAIIDEELCCGCKICIGVCPYEAISYNAEKEISQIEEALCKGCGACVAACGSGASRQQSFKDEQIIAEIEGALIVF